MRTRDDGTRCFSVDNAVNFGVDEAIFVQYLMDKLQAACVLLQQGRGQDNFELVVEEGQPWMPWTIDDFSKELPFWSIKQIRRIIASCKGQGLIKTGNYNQSLLERRLWYTLEGVTVNEWQGN